MLKSRAAATSKGRGLRDETGRTAKSRRYHNQAAKTPSGPPRVHMCSKLQYFLLAAVVAFAVLLARTISTLVTDDQITDNHRVSHRRYSRGGHVVQQSRRKELQQQARPREQEQAEPTLPRDEQSFRTSNRVLRPASTPTQQRAASAIATPASTTNKQDQSAINHHQEYESETKPQNPAAPDEPPATEQEPQEQQQTRDQKASDYQKYQNGMKQTFTREPDEAETQPFQDEPDNMLQNSTDYQTQTLTQPTLPPVTLHPLLLSAQNRTVLWVHVGKAGGSSFKRILRRISQCDYNHKMTPEEKLACYHQPLQPKETQISYLVRHQMHMQYKPKHVQTGQDIIDSFTTLLFSLRNPWTRLHSAYHYGHPTNSKSVIASQTDDLKHHIYRCFPTLESLGLALVPDFNGNNSNCTVDLAHQALLHKTLATRRVNIHVYADYQYYLKPIRQWIDQRQQQDGSVGSTSANTTEVWALRMEYLWNDTKRLEQALGGNPVKTMRGLEKIHARQTASTAANMTTARDKNNGTLATAGSTNNSNASAAADANSTAEKPSFSPVARLALCCVYLWDELEAYQWILQRAANLEPFQQQEAMDAAMLSCGLLQPYDENGTTTTTFGLFDFGPSSYARQCANYHKGERIGIPAIDQLRT